jgi:hypothetical protein
MSVVTLVASPGLSAYSPIDRVRRKQNTLRSTRSVYQNKDVVRRIALLPCVTVKAVVEPYRVLVMNQIDRSKSIHVQISIDISTRLRSGPFLFLCDHNFTWTSYGIGGSMSSSSQGCSNGIILKFARRIYMHI